MIALPSHYHEKGIFFPFCCSYWDRKRDGKSSFCRAVGINIHDFFFFFFSTGDHPWRNTVLLCFKRSLVVWWQQVLLQHGFLLRFGGRQMNNVLRKKRTRIAKGPLPVAGGYRRMKLKVIQVHWKGIFFSWSKVVFGGNLSPCRPTGWCISEIKCFIPKRWKIIWYFGKYLNNQNLKDPTIQIF